MTGRLLALGRRRKAEMTDYGTDTLGGVWKSHLALKEMSKQRWDLLGYWDAKSSLDSGCRALYNIKE